jgi:CheY-like chemotaxis protein/anti-sigma regulatory factor (Ser/Thr protein kinase)
LRPQIFDAGAQITSITDMLRSVLGSRIELEINSDCPDCFVEADVAQFETAIVNLAVNARDAMSGEGKVGITIHRTADADTDYVCVEVSDSGHGIPPEQIARIFEPFFTTKEVGKGTGLGLSQVYGFTKQSAGEVKVESIVGRGTTFRLLLPTREKETEGSASEAKPTTVTLGGRLLIVEDNAQVRGFAEDLLGELGFMVDVASSAGEALEKLAAGSRYDVIFSDVVMPGMSGIDFAKVVRKQSPEVAIVLTSGYSHVLVEEGRHGFPLLQKPYSASDLAQALHDAQASARELDTKL